MLRIKPTVIEAFGLAMQVLIVALLLHLCTTLDAYHLDAARGRQRIIELEEGNRVALLAFLTRTVDRWDYLYRENPQLTVPKVIEPLTQKHLDAEDLQRRAPR